jgi:hypothetical protein
MEVGVEYQKEVNLIKHPMVEGLFLSPLRKAHCRLETEVVILHSAERCFGQGSHRHLERLR